MSKVKFDFSTVRTRVIPILKRVEVEDYPAKIGRVYGWSRQHVSYYIGKLEQCGLVKRKVRSRAVFYELTTRTYLALMLDSINLEDLLNRMDEDVALEILAAMTTLS